MMTKMIIGNLVHRPIRSLISIVAVALEVALILLIAGLAYGIMNDSKGRQAGVGADVVVQPPGATNLVAIGGAPVSVKVADILRKLPHVAVVSPVIWQLSTAGSLEVIDGIDLPTFEALGGPFQYLQGGPFQKPNEMLVDDYIARQKNVKVGDAMEVLNHEFRVAGIVEQADPPAVGHGIERTGRKKVRYNRAVGKLSRLSVRCLDRKRCSVLGSLK